MFRYRSLCRTCLTTVALLSVLSASVNVFNPRGAAAPQGENYFASTQFRLLIASDAAQTVTSISDYMKNWEALPGIVTKLNNNVPLSAVEVRLLLARAEPLKGELRNLQTGLGGVTQKLKTEGKFSLELDNFVLSQLQTQGGSALEVVRFIEQENKVRGLLDSANQRITAQLSKIDDLVKQAKAGDVARAHAPAAPARFVCTALAFKVVTKVLKGTSTPKDSDDFKKECSQ